MSPARTDLPKAVRTTSIFAAAASIGLVVLPSRAQDEGFTPRQLIDLTAMIPPAALDWHAPPHGQVDPGERGAGLYGEDFEGFLTGVTVHNQHGWGVAVVGGLNALDDAAALASGMDGFGGASLRLSNFDPAGSVRTASPIFEATDAPIGVDVHCTPIGACYQGVEFVDDESGVVVTRVLLAPGGPMFVLQLDGAGEAQYNFASGAWPANQTFRLGLRFSSGVNEIQIVKDGAVIFTGHNVASRLDFLGKIIATPEGVTSVGPVVFADTSSSRPTGAGWYDNISTLVTCRTDPNADGVTNTADLGIVLSEFGSAGGLGDMNGDGIVNTPDLGIIIGRFGQGCD